MANIFDRSEYPTQEPYELIIGDRWVWKREDLHDLYTVGSYTLTYYFDSDTGGGSSNSFNIAATGVTDTYFVEVGSSTTANYTADDYIWNAFITRDSDSERVLVDSGKLTIKANFAATTVDQRSHNKKVLDALKALMENKATIDQSSMSIAGRSLSRLTPEELRDWIKDYEGRVKEKKRLQELKMALHLAIQLK